MWIYVPTIFSFTKPPSDTAVARQSRLEKRRAKKEREEEEKEKAEQERLEMELLEQEAIQGLLAMSLPSSVATQTEKIPMTDSCQQTDKQIMTVKETQTQGSECTSSCMVAQSARVPLNGTSAMMTGRQSFTQACRSGFFLSNYSLCCHHMLLLHVPS